MLQGSDDHEANGDDDLFDNTKATTTSTSTATSSTKTNKLGGLFSEEDEDDGDGDIFSQLTTMKTKEETTPPETTPPVIRKKDTPSIKQSEGLFGDDDLFNNETPSTEETIKHESPKPVKKKPAGAVSMFGGVDPFAKKKGPPLTAGGSRDILTDSIEKEGGDLFTSMKESDEPKKKKEEKQVSVIIL